jgi:two-component system, NarL family, nitrate/nitrite response regulator NarL
MTRRESQAEESSPATITPRERQVLCRIARGKTSKQIAAELTISLRTVNTHRENLARKLGTSSVAGLTRFVIEHQLDDAL